MTGSRASQAIVEPIDSRPVSVPGRHPPRRTVVLARPFRLLAKSALATLLALGLGNVSGQERSGRQGQQLFDTYCSACHQYDDQGMGEAPPLEGAPWVLGPAERLIRIVLHGVTGRMVVADKEYDREMPGFGEALSNRQIATVATYVRARFGSSTAPVSEAEVQRVREEHAGRTSYWQADELLELR